jgi:hypothetical protein
MGGGGLRKEGDYFWRVLLDLLVESLSSVVGKDHYGGAPVCWGFWARGPGYPYGILELGSCPSWQGGNTVWAELISIKHQAGQGSSRKVNKTSGSLASDQGILI